MKPKQYEDVNGFPITVSGPEISSKTEIVPSKPEVVPTRPLPINEGSITKITINGEPIPVDHKVAEMPIASTEQYGVTQLSNDITEDETKAATPKALYTLQEIVDEKIAQLELKMPKIYYHTKEYWDAQPTLVSEDQAIYVYTNYQSASGKDVAGMKIGDGSSYLIDVPFMDEVLMSHIQDTTIHITQQEREFWNNKVRSYVSDVSEEELIFTIH